MPTKFPKLTGLRQRSTGLRGGVAPTGPTINRGKGNNNAATVELRPLPGLVGLFAGSDGHVYSSRRNWKGGRLRKLAEFPDKDGYRIVDVTNCAGKKMRLRVHKWVLLAFKGEPPSNLHETRHLNGNRADNRPANLDWGTQKDNAADRDLHGRTVYGPRQKLAKFTAEQVHAIRQRLLLGHGYKAIATDFGATADNVGKLARGHSYFRVRDDNG